MEPLPTYIYKTAIFEFPIGLLGPKTAEVPKLLEEYLNGMASGGWQFIQMYPLPGAATFAVCVFQKPVVSASDLDR